MTVDLLLPSVTRQASRLANVLLLADRRPDLSSLLNPDTEEARVSVRLAHLSVAQAET